MKMSYHYIPYNKFYYNNLCHVCKESSENLKRCSVCKTVAYCSKNHQKHDWKYHKDLCRVIAKTDYNLKHFSVHNFEDFKRYNVSRSLLWHTELSRPLFNFESQMWMFPRVCALCFSKDVIIDCPDCLNVSYCSELHTNFHKEQHSKFCGALKVCMDIDLYYFHEKFIPSNINTCKFDSGLNTLPNNLSELLCIYEKGNIPKESNSEDMIQFIIKSNLIAPIATIIHGMEKSGLIKNRLFSKYNLTVHIVGAESTETAWHWEVIIELLFHWINNLKSVNFHLIGPQLNLDGNVGNFTEKLCDNCKANHLSIKVMCHCKLYHEIVDTLEDPDIVVAFNSGLHEAGQNPWHQSIDSLTTYSEVPLLLTAYTLKEIILDIDTVISKSTHKVSVVSEPQKNPFSNMTPIRDWETENSPVFYVNGYFAVLKAG